ncbi:CRAL/TRIO domain-containing protein [Viridothelium virens]|uniref:CRAL/TRIO domain-containing protein n=1 Tax=Viridothelium virens TaxID=1048519 RepID=A0A6A6H4Y4_VIRVR|nr:CRAL/TRIO domain-containing protein [Viridothelium virens]
MAENKLKRTDSYQYPSGHLGHLSDNQQAALGKFKVLCQEKGYYKPAEASAKALPSHDDETLLRYLRARKFVPHEAFTQFKDTEDWRKNNQLEELYESIDVNEYDQTRRLYPQWTGRRDKRGMPLYVFEVAHLDSKNIAAYEASTSKAPQITSKVPAKMLRLFALYEAMCRFVLPLCSAVPDRPHQETPISQSNNIVDISRVGLKQFWNLKNHMQDASTLATAHYPETLDRIFIIGAPSFFPTVWGWIKRWFDPITVSKIFILSNTNMKSTLEQYIDSENIPKKYGGKLDYEFGMMPVLEPAIQNSLKWSSESAPSSQKTLPIGPIRWQEGANGEMEAMAVGSVDGKPRNERIAVMNPGQRWNARSTLLTVPARTMSNGPAANDSTPSEIYRTTTGDHTHPANGNEAETNLEKDEPPPSYTDEAGTVIPPEKQIPDTSRRGTYTVPVQAQEGVTSPLSPSGADTTSTNQRQGTSETRFEQQDATHATGILAEGTPEVRHHGHGDKTSTMEPKTVGQAPKEVPRPEVREGEGEGEGYVARAQAVASNAYQEAGKLVGEAQKSVMGTVGLGDKEEGEKEVETQAEKTDPVVDNMKETNVEEYLRSTVGSETQPLPNA